MKNAANQEFVLSRLKALKRKTPCSPFPDNGVVREEKTLPLCPTSRTNAFDLTRRFHCSWLHSVRHWLDTRPENFRSYFCCMTTTTREESPYAELADRTLPFYHSRKGHENNNSLDIVEAFSHASQPWARRNEASHTHQQNLHMRLSVIPLQCSGLPSNQHSAISSCINILNDIDVDIGLVPFYCCYCYKISHEAGSINEQSTAYRPHQGLMRQRSNPVPV